MILEIEPHKPFHLIYISDLILKLAEYLMPRIIKPAETLGVFSKIIIATDLSNGLKERDIETGPISMRV